MSTGLTLVGIAAGVVGVAFVHHRYNTGFKEGFNCYGDADFDIARSGSWDPFYRWGLRKGFERKKNTKLPLGSFE